MQPSLLVCYEGKEHRVSLGDGAMTILEKMAELRSGDTLFPGQAAGRPRSNMTVNTMQRRMKRDDLTVDGFRSTFPDWAAKCMTFPAEVAEMAWRIRSATRVDVAIYSGSGVSLPRRGAQLCCAPADNAVELQAAR